MEPLANRLPEGRFETGKDGAGILVVGYDGTEPSRNALAYAAGLARPPWHERSYGAHAVRFWWSHERRL